MRKLFRLLWNLVTALYRIVVLLLLILLGVAVWAALQDVAPVRVPDKVALVLAPSGDVVDHLDTDPMQRALEQWAGEMPSQTLLRDLTDALYAAAGDPRIHAVVLKLDDMWSLGQAQARELAAALQAVRRAGKKVHAHELYYGQTAYLLAAQADTVSVDPMGAVWIEGFSAYNNYFRDALDKFGVTVNVFRVGAYKSAVEPFLRMDMSPEAREANRDWLEDLWRAYRSDVEIARSMTPQTIDAYVEDLIRASDGDAAELARRHGLVTHVETREAFRARLGAELGFDPSHGSFRQIHHADYLNAARRESRLPGADQRNEVALVVVQGDIVDGVAEQGMADGALIAQQLDEARRDDAVRAVVLRINSPGGSVFGSERIRRAVQRVRADGKPVVVSMGDLAASGGYWAAMDASRIFAQETTLTGSIGIFGLLPTVDQGLGKLGVATDGLGTTELAGSMRADRPLGDAARGVIQREIEHGYKLFIENVARARKLPIERVRQIAEGRVWSGSDALRLGLIDELGTLTDAADAAAGLAGLPAGGYRLREFREQSRFPLRWLSPFGASIRVPWLGGWLKQALLGDPAAALASRFGWMRDPRGLYAHCLCADSLRQR